MSEEIHPLRGEDWIRVEFWKCNVLGHRHQSKKAAAACILRRKGEVGELRRLQRDLAIISKLRSGHSLVSIAKQFYCSDSNVMKAANSSLRKAWKFAKASGGSQYQTRSWKLKDFTEQNLQQELDYFYNIMREMEVKLKSLV
jgi:hypothetical protein